jgi:hypothetical protein
LIEGAFLVEGIAATDWHRMPIQMHVDCVARGDEERREPQS